MTKTSIPAKRRPRPRRAADGPWLLSPPAASPPPPPPPSAAPPAGLGAVLFDRDGTLIEDVPYNADPALVRPFPRVREALDALRARGIALGVVSNQSGAARGYFGRDGVEAVRRRVEELLGPFGVWAVCPHAPWDCCACRKPAPGLVLAACARLGVPAAPTAVVGDIGSDMAAARAAGARGVLVPTPVTRREEIVAAHEWAPDVLTAVRRLLAGDAPGERDA
ncbi:D-glycero-alpha-D-manno-heptose-1,7-bisphosphate 7-phosphatase [Streptomyces sp. URMC 129]|uniref:D-glycero-alpha-D-manno-heptose-1,7-bisphosphate 7-phosphatase n=1 Tax=Streptomyces sp. URMC 129 TaxID=3423407 RepID=UPI003F195E00